MKIVERMVEKGKISNREIREMFDISSQASHKEINKLVKLRVVKRKGKGRGIYYELK